MPADLLAILRKFITDYAEVERAGNVDGTIPSALTDSLPALLAYVEAADAMRGISRGAGWNAMVAAMERLDTARASLARQLNGGME